MEYLCVASWPCIVRRWKCSHREWMNCFVYGTVSCNLVVVCGCCLDGRLVYLDEKECKRVGGVMVVILDSVL